MDNKKYEKSIGFLLGERYRLEVHWKSVTYDKEGVCKLNGAFFSGPALQFAEKIEANNQMLIDFYKQYYIFAENVYIATLSWGEVVYKKDGNVQLKHATISHNTELNRVPKLNNDDYLVIDLAGHDSAEHVFNPTYITIVVDSEGKAYNFWNYHGIYKQSGEMP